MTAAMILLVVRPHVGVLQPMHPAAQIAVVRRKDDQMEVVGHQAETISTYTGAIAFMNV